MNFVKRAAAVAAAVAVSAVAALGSTGTAQAATVQFQLCNYGSDYTVQAYFPGRGGFSTRVVNPQACTTTTAGTGEQFYLAAAASRGRITYSRVDRTYGSGRTLVQTWGSVSSFTYGKLPY